VPAAPPLPPKPPLAPVLPASVFPLPPLNKSSFDSPPHAGVITGNMRKDTQEIVATIEFGFMSFDPVTSARDSCAVRNRHTEA
jgi:hypothetical protein